MGFSRDTVYIANVLKCRPDMPRGSFGNRPPTPEEMQTCLPYLAEQIEIIRPKVMVALGATAVEGLLGTRAPMHAMRGRWQSFQALPPNEQARVRENFHKFQQLPPARRQTLREQWRSATPAQRQQMIEHAREQRQNGPMPRPSQAPRQPHR